MAINGRENFSDAPKQTTPRQIKVVHMTSVHPAFDTRIFHKECVSLSNAGMDVTLIARHDMDEVVKGVKIKHFKPRNTGRLKRMLFTSWTVLRMALAEKADIYHFHDPELIPSAIILRLSGAKVIYDVHEDVPRQILSKKWIQAILRYPIARMIAIIEWISVRFFFNGVVAATPLIAQRFPRQKTTTVQNFPILQGPSNHIQTLNYRDRNNVIAYIGAIAHVRGAVEMVAAMNLVQSSTTELLIGGRIDPESLSLVLKEMAGWQRVNYLGWLNQSQITESLGKARVGLVTLHPVINYFDSYPVKMFEYMRAGLPVIASDFPFWRKLIGAYDCCIFVDPMDPKAIAQAIDWILENSEEAEEMGKRGRAAVQEVFNWPREEKKLVSFYGELSI